MEQLPSQDWIGSTIITASSDAIMFADRDGIIRLWNSGAEQMFGYSRDEALGQSLDIIIPENLRQRHWEGYRRVMETGESHYSVDLLSAPATRRDGTRISTQFSMVLLKEGPGRMLGCAAIVRDVTAQWQREKELKERIKHLEAESSPQ